MKPKKTELAETTGVTGEMTENMEMRRRIGILAVVALTIFAMLVGYLACSMLDEARYANLAAMQQQELHKLHLAEQGLDENGVRVDRMRSYYSNGPFDVSLLNTDEEFKEYCKEHFSEAVYPTNGWKLDEIVQSYYDSPEIWGYWEDAYYMSGFYFCWTPDYQHCFILDVGYSSAPDYADLTSGWLVVDGVRVMALDQEVGSIEPETLIADYQSGKWDGSVRMSPDWSTRAYVNGSGDLSYWWSIYRYDETTDPEKLAYTGYDQIPWWKEEIDSDLAALLEDEYYAPFYGDRDHYASGSMDLKLYVDFPVEHDTGEYFLTQRWDGRTFGLTRSGVCLAEKGQILCEWKLSLLPGMVDLLMAAENPTPEQAHDLAYLYDGQRLIALVDDGTMRTVIEETVALDRGVSGGSFDLWGLNDQSLIHWTASRGYNEVGSEVIAENVQEVYFGKIRMLVKEDGCYAITRDYDAEVRYPVVYLGTEAPEFYDKQYQLMDGAKVYRW